MWIVAAIVAFASVKIIGLFPTISAFATYWVLKPRIGVALSLLAAVVVAGAVFIAAIAYFAPVSPVPGQGLIGR